MAVPKTTNSWVFVDELSHHSKSVYTHSVRFGPGLAIAHADMDAFYAAVEQLDNPSLPGRPVLVGPNSRREVVLTQCDAHG